MNILSYIRSLIQLGAILSILFVLHPAHADHSTTDSAVIVWGTKVSSNDNSIDAESITIEQADHISDLLRNQPGVEVGGSHSVNQRINIRGLDDTDLDVTLDGANQNSFMYHHAGNLAINPDILKSINTKIGNNSVVNGGLGGTVTMETKDPQDLLKEGQSIGAQINVNHNSNKHLGGSLSVYGKSESGLDAMIYAHGIDRDNHVDGSNHEVVGNEGTIQNGLIKLGKNFNEGNRLELSHDVYHDQGDYTARPDMGARTSIAIDGGKLFPTTYQRNTTALNGEFELTDALSLRTHASYNELSLSREKKSTSSSTITEGKANNERAYIQLEGELNTGNITHDITTGIDALAQTSRYFKNQKEGSKEDTLNLALYAEDRIGLGSIFTITPGIRLDRYQANTATTDKTFEQTSGALATEAAFQNGFSIRMSTRQLFKGPEMAETFINRAAKTISNPNIKPETGVNNEASLKYQQSHVLGADAFSVTLTAYKTLIKDSIIREDYPHDALTGRGAPSWYNNGADLELTGGEFNTVYQISRHAFQLGYATSDSEFKDTGKPVDREIGDKATIGWGYSIPKTRLTLNISGIHVFEETHTKREQPKQAYSVGNLALSWQPTQLDNLLIRFAIDNFTNEQYVSHASRTGSFNHPRFGQLVLDDYEPGRNIKTSITYKF